MKLRMKGNSIRLRLTQSEVARLRNGERIEETCEFANGAGLTWALRPASAAAVAAMIDGAHITVSVPAYAIEQWATGEQVGIYAMSGPVDVSIEKDFQCVGRTGGEEDADAFPNPAPCQR